MFMKLFTPILLVVTSAVTPVFSLPARASNVFARDDHEDKNLTHDNGNNSMAAQKVMRLNDTATKFPDLEYLAEGNEYFRSAVKNSSQPDLLKKLTENGQHPEYLFLGCRFVTILHPQPPNPPLLLRLLSDVNFRKLISLLFHLVW
jgi:hypothetical protein